jgi:hypothetical protein
MAKSKREAREDDLAHIQRKLVMKHFPKVVKDPA